MEVTLFAIRVGNLIKDLLNVGVAISEVIVILDRSNSILQQVHDEKRDITQQEWDHLDNDSDRLRAARPDISDRQGNL